MDYRKAPCNPRVQDGGEGGIRTHDTVARMPHFECGAFDHSATSPGNLVGAICARRLIAASHRLGKLLTGDCENARVAAMCRISAGINALGAIIGGVANGVAEQLQS